MLALTWCLFLYFSARCYALDPQVNTTERSTRQMDLEHLQISNPGDRNPRQGNVPVEAVRLSSGTYLFHLKTMNWEDAHNFCRSKGMDLLAIESVEENEALSQHGKTLNFFTPYNGAWTSGCYHRHHSNFVWHSTGRNMKYTNWWSGYPKAQADGNCIIFYPPDPRWWEVATSQLLPVICEL